MALVNLFRGLGPFPAGACRALSDSCQLSLSRARDEPSGYLTVCAVPGPPQCLEGLQCVRVDNHFCGHPCRAHARLHTSVGVSLRAYLAAHARRCHVCGRPGRVHARPYMLRLEPVGGCVVAGAFEDCCLAYHPRARLSVLRHAQSYHRQDVSGSCNLPAVM